MPDDPLASQRADLLEKLDGAEALLLAAVEDLRRSGDAGQMAQSEGQLAVLAKLRDQVGKADPAVLSQLRTAVVAMVATTQSAASESRAAGSAAQQVQAHELAMLATESRAQVMALTRDMHRFDALLDFASPEEERAYRDRESERRGYIAEQQAKRSPEGDLNASGGMLGQMVDAKAHGANSLEFQQRLDALVKTTEKLRDAAKANGISTEEFDRHLRDDLRRIMKSKGLSEADIDARFAAASDPLDAAKDYLRSEQDIGTVEQGLKRVATASAPPLIATGGPQNAGGLDSITAKLQASGIGGGQTPETTHAPAHGVAIAVRDASATVLKG